MATHAVCITIASCQSTGRTGWSVSRPWASTPLRCGVAAGNGLSLGPTSQHAIIQSLLSWALLLQLYVPWNYHERFPGQYTWDGMANVVRFIKLIQVSHAKLAHHEVQGLKAAPAVPVSEEQHGLLQRCCSAAGWAHDCPQHALAVHQTSLTAGPGHDGAAARRPLHLRRMGLWRLPLVAGQQHGEQLCPGTHTGTALLRSSCCQVGMQHTGMGLVGRSCTAWHPMRTLLSTTGSSLIQLTTQAGCAAG